MHLKGVLFFPVTPFGADGRLAEEMLARHVDQGVAKGAGGVFAACGTGEFHALDADEYERVVRVAAETTAGRVPVLAGAGGSLPYARECARRAAAAGADGLLVMPPYLVSAPPEGVARYVRELAAATDLPLIVYLRGNARLTPDTAASLTELPNVIGFKDGLGDIDLFQRILLTVRRTTDRELLFINGLPTAEMTAHAYRGLGVPLYSSAVYGFLPEVALAFYRALTGGDDKLAQLLLTEFYRPLVELRDQVPGYAVALIKAGVTLRGIDAGAVRPPLVDPTPEHIARLERLIARGLEIAGC